eukprot:scaffold746_cov508-Prasinococcus_capsulatus_cf.AAC.5
MYPRGPAGWHGRRRAEQGAPQGVGERRCARPPEAAPGDVGAAAVMRALMHALIDACTHVWRPARRGVTKRAR